MSSEFREFPLSDLKRARLRKAGVVPFSADVITAAVVVGVFLGVVVMWNTSAKEIMALFSPDLPSGGSQAVLRAAGCFIKAAGAIVGLVVALVVLAGGLQTRFLFTTEPLGFDFSRLFYVGAFAPKRVISLAITAVTRLVRAVGWIVVSFLLLRYVFIQLVPDVDLKSLALKSSTVSGAQWDDPPVKRFPVGREITRERVVEAIGRTERAFKLSFILATGFCLFVAVLSRIIVGIQFNQQHRMSRAELEAEYREMEQRPEIKQAQIGRGAEGL